MTGPHQLPRNALQVMIMGGVILMAKLGIVNGNIHNVLKNECFSYLAKVPFEFAPPYIIILIEDPKT